MSLSLILLVLLAAVLHAAWNALVKTGGDRLIVLAIFMAIACVVCTAFLPFVEVPTSRSWVFIILSIIIHTAYYLSLAKAYDHGDLSHVYPVARGLAPVIVLMGGVWFVGEIPQQNQWLGVLVVSGGIMSLAFEKGVPWRSADNTAFHYALLTGFWIAAYTLVDGMGARAANNPMDYILWLFALEGWPIFFYTLYLRGNLVFKYFRDNTLVCLFGGISSACAYGIVIFALSLGFMAGVSALRETSVVIATLIGIFVFKEDSAIRRIVAAAVVAGGVILMNA